MPRTCTIREATVHINPTGRFVIGGPRATPALRAQDHVDTYGGRRRHGGVGVQREGPDQVDRSGPTPPVDRQNLVAGLATRWEVQLAYASGVAEPVSVMVDTFGTGDTSDEILSTRIRELWDLRPKEIIRALDLRRPIYRPTSAYGHFGRPPEDGLFTWERTDRVDALRDGLS